MEHEIVIFDIRIHILLKRSVNKKSFHWIRATPFLFYGEPLTRSLPGDTLRRRYFDFVIRSEKTNHLELYRWTVWCSKQKASHVRCPITSALFYSSVITVDTYC
ncbi:hypothetical protein CSKR_203048 [Clonorchis sinensis]|uniref:Uncharacterized protein n=1 Tax=Clonorchis sinensis TaxID=79923 RepID=A0A8T1M706_CLOSI|nr:hypothetical protein CSKR_203048 [Clonorchis sinensis]